MKYVIYAFIDEQNNPYYIGKTCNFKKRRTQHLSNIKNVDNKLPKYNKTRKLLKKDFKFKMKILEDNIASKDINKKEKQYIKNIRKIHKLYNLTNGEDGCDSDGGKYAQSFRKHFKHSEKTKIKMSKSAQGRIFSKTHKSNLKKSHKGLKGKYHSQKTKDQIGFKNKKSYIIETNKGKKIKIRGLQDFCNHKKISRITFYKRSKRGKFTKGYRYVNY